MWIYFVVATKHLELDVFQSTANLFGQSALLMNVRYFIFP